MPGNPDNTTTLTINNFSPGIIVDTRTGSAGQYLDLPPGTAGISTTGCYALPNGALAPLPGHHASLDQIFTASGAMDAASTMRPIGLFTVGPLAVSAAGDFTQNTHFADELHFMFQGPSSFNAGIVEYEWHIRKLYFPSIPLDIITTQIGFSPPGPIHGVTGITARLLHANFGNPGLPTFITEWGERPLAGGFANDMWQYPNPAATTSDTPHQISYGPVQLTQLAGRVIYLKTTAYNHGANSGVYYTNEDIFYTDPPNSDVTTGNQATVLDADNPSGFMSWGSLVYGELFLVRRYGGALTIDGDIYAPQVTILKGVQSVGNLMNVASSSPSGLIYCVDDDGAYIWQGGNSSQKISTIPDRFYDRGAGNPTSGIAVKHTRWNQFVVFPNGWTFDTVTNAWWNLDSTADIALVEAGKGSPNLLFTAPDAWDTPSTCQVSVYDTTMPADNYSWYSQPIRLTDNTTIDVKGVTVAASSIPQHGATVEVWVETNNRIFTPFATFTFAAHGILPNVDYVAPIRLSEPSGTSNLPHLLFFIQVKSTTPGEPAPIVTAISFDWMASTPLPQDQ